MPMQAPALGGAPIQRTDRCINIQIRRQGDKGSGVWEDNPKTQDMKSKDFELKPASLES